ncbi:MAG: AmmeMemoRadiSam system protein B [Nitrospirae bacterium]|nr:MAG: AmmeMemoRadiSam system protein B [Nitrospirota bacterium]
MATIRQPAVAGQFYSADADTLAADVVRYTESTAVPTPAIAVVCPHAGLMYSGHVAGAVYARVALPQTVILLGPNHRGMGPPLSVYARGTWLVPGGALAVDEALAEIILARDPAAEADTTAHQYEHCLEVQLPFLRRFRPDVRIVPILLGHLPDRAYADLGRRLGDILREAADREGPQHRPLLVASTDLTHYESDAVTRAKDRHAIEAIRNLDPEGLGAAVRAHRITMCGYGATVAMLHAARSLGAGSASLVRYATSGDITGDHDSVVGYAGLLIA